jgi:hypothetical protein
MKSMLGTTLALLALAAVPLAAQTTDPAVKKPAVSGKPMPAKAAGTTQELGAEQQERMKQYQDRRAKADATASSVMKKTAETQSNVSGNLK